MTLEPQENRISPPAIAVIIPTHNRRDGLLRTLDALGKQELKPERFEVVVVADGCEDDTVALVRAYAAPYPLTCLEQAASGPATARNNGAKATRAPVLLFLDDDIEAAPTLVRAHLEAQTSGDDKTVVIGYLPTVLTGQEGLFRAALRGWWEDMFQNMAQPGHRFTYADLLSGNFSVKATTFWLLGGFDTDLRCHEDYELGYRLIHAGGQLQFAREAMGWHHERTDIDRSLRRKQEEGKADIVLGKRYPELRPGLVFSVLWKNRTPPPGGGVFWHLFAASSRLVCYAAFAAPGIGDAIARIARPLLDFLEQCRLRHIWRLLLNALMAYWYWRGVTTGLPTRADLDTFLKPVTVPGGADTEMVDLAEGIAAAEARINRTRPASIQIHYGAQYVGELPALPGAEGLRGIHLRAALATTLAETYGNIAEQYNGEAV